jgi:hypothetical protein
VTGSQREAVRLTAWGGRYASRAKKIQMSVNVNSVNVEFHIAEYQKIIAGLREEVFELKKQMSQDEGSPGGKGRGEAVKRPEGKDREEHGAGRPALDMAEF